MNEPIELWHTYMRTRDTGVLDGLIAEDCVFTSPVVHTPQVGRAVTLKYLRAAAVVLGNDSFRYVGEWHGSGSAVLEFACELDGIAVNGIDMIGWNEAGQITSFKVMVRPLKAINMVHAMMGAQLAAA